MTSFLLQITFCERFRLGTFLLGTIPQNPLWLILSDIVSWCFTTIFPAAFYSYHLRHQCFVAVTRGGQTVSYIFCPRFTRLFYLILCVYYPTWQPAQRKTCLRAGVQLQRHPLPSLQFFCITVQYFKSHEITIYLFLINYPMNIHLNRIDH